MRLEVERRHIQEAYDMRITAESEQAKSACDNIIKGIEGRIRRLTETKEELSALIKTEREKSATAKNIEGLSTLYKKNLVEIGENFETKERLVKTLIKRVEIHTDVLRVYFQFTNPSSPYETKNNARLISMDYGRKHIS
ncbi:MAG TPA: hypothetical protein PK765_06655 [bacterium]|nr:hypothetical protein [bacterium]